MLGQLFDPKAELAIYEHCRPHWSQAGAVVFITFRTEDSIPREVIERWDREKGDWFRVRGYGAAAHWSKLLPTLTEVHRQEFLKQFNRHREIECQVETGRIYLSEIP